MDKWRVSFDASDDKSEMPNVVGSRGYENLALDTKKKTTGEVENMKSIIQKKCWDISIAPLKSLGMNLFMIWMSGSSHNIFSILMLGYAIVGVISTLTKVNVVFEPLKDAIELYKVPTISYKLIYLTICLGALLIVGNSAAKTGIIPSCSADFLKLLPLINVSGSSSLAE